MKKKKSSNFNILLKNSLILVILLNLIIGGFSIVAADPTVSANINASNHFLNQNEPMIANDPIYHNQLVVGYNDYRTGGPSIGWSWSENGGETWNYGGNIIPDDYDSAGAPVVAFNRWGQTYIAGLCMDYIIDDPLSGHFENNSIFIARSFDRGRTFNSPKILAEGSGVDIRHEKPWLLIDPRNDNIYVAWTRFTSNSQLGTIMLTYSKDGGIIWSEPIQVSQLDFNTYPISHGAQIAVGPDDTIFVSWFTWFKGRLDDDNDGIIDSGWNPPEIFISASYDDSEGLQFGTNYKVATKSYSYPARFPCLTSNISTGKVYIAYVDRPTFPGDLDIFVASSTYTNTGFEPWTITRVNDDPEGNDIEQSWPSIDIAPHGRIDIIWYDERVESGKKNVYYSYSIDEGATWEVNTKLTDLISGFSWPPQEFYAGNYITVASTDKKAQVVWMDHREDMNLEIYYADVTHHEPVASFTKSVLTAAIETPITFDASNSYDPDGTIDLYEWDFNNDGAFDATGVTTTYAFSTIGIYTITLRVTDNDGLTATATDTLNIQSANKWYFGIVDSGIDPSIAVDSSGIPHIAYYTGGYIPQGVTGRLSPGMLKYAKWIGPSYNDWLIEIVDSSSRTIGLYPVIALNSSDVPSIVYTNYSNGNLMYATRNPVTGEWTSEIFDGTPPLISFDYFDATIAFDSLDNLHASYVSSEGDQFDPPNFIDLDHSLFYRESISAEKDQITYGEGYQAYSPSLALDRQDTAHIVFYEKSLGDISGRRCFLKYAVNQDGWRVGLIDTINRFSCPSTIAITPSLGVLARMVAYISEEGLKIAQGDWPWVPMVDPWKPGLYPESFVIDSNASSEINLRQIWSGPKMAYRTTDGELRFVGWTPSRGWCVETVDPGPVHYLSMDNYSFWGFSAPERIHLAYSGSDGGDIYYASNKVPSRIIIKVSSLENGDFSLSIDAGTDLGAPFTSWTELSSTNVQVPYDVTSSDDNTEMFIEGQLIDPEVEGKIILEIHSNGKTITYEIQIIPYENQPPIAVDDSESTNMNVEIEIDVLSNDYDPDGTIDSTTVNIVSNPRHGTIVVDPDTGVITYTPDDGYCGEDSFSYTVKDNKRYISEVAQVSITIRCISPPIAKIVFRASVEGRRVHVTYDPSLSIDYDGEIYWYHWDWGNDGRYDEHDRSPIVYSFTYTLEQLSAERISVKLMVEDDDELTGIAILNVNQELISRVISELNSELSTMMMFAIIEIIIIVALGSYVIYIRRKR